MYCYLNDQFVEDGKIPVSDIGLTRGFGIFDFLRTYNGKPFKLKEHLQRFRNSAKLVNLKIEKSDAVLEELVLHLMKKNDLKEANIKLILTGGKSQDGILPLEEPTLILTTNPTVTYPTDLYQNGIATITFSHERFLPACKSLYYIPAILALQKARARGAFEVLYTSPKGQLLEGTTCNFFCFKDGVLLTPESGILRGITREVTLFIAQGNFPITKRSIYISELPQIDEAFLTSSNKEIMPIVKIDDFVIGNGRPGENTQKMIELFQEYTRKK